MGLLSSKTLIRAHALFLFVLAVYLTRSPEVITDSDVVYMIGEAMRIVCLFLFFFFYLFSSRPIYINNPLATNISTLYGHT